MFPHGAWWRVLERMSIACNPKISCLFGLINNAIAMNFVLTSQRGGPRRTSRTGGPALVLQLERWHRACRVKWSVRWQDWQVQEVTGRQGAHAVANSSSQIESRKRY